MGIGSSGLSRAGVGIGGGGLGGSGLEGADASDPFFENVSLLAGFEGANGQTTYTSEDVSEHVFTFVGNAQISTARARFGESSIMFDGAGDYVTIPDSPVFALADQDFTIEFFVNFNGDPFTNQNLMGQWNQQGVNQRSYHSSLVSGTTMRFGYSTTGANEPFIDKPWNPPGDTWQHIAVVRSDDQMLSFVEGTQVGTPTAFAFNLHDSTATWNISGVQGPAGFVNFFNGWIDEVRVTQGVARYTGNFQAPNQPFPRS